VGQTVGFSISSSGGAAPLSFSWDFGDGTPPTAFSSSSTASHAFAAAGHYAVKVTVRNSAGESSSSYTQTVHHPATTGKPSASSSIIIDNARNRIWAVNSDTNSVTAINGADNTRLFERVVGKDPRTLAQAPDGSIWVVNLDDATISVLDRDTGSTLQTIALPPGSQPYGLAFSPNGSAAFVATQGSGQLLRLNPATRALAGSLALGGSLRGIAVSHDSARVLVTRFISPADQGEVIEVGAASFAVVRTIALAHDPGPDGNINGRGVPNYLSSITISPDGRQARVPSKKDNTSRGSYRDGLPLNFESTVRTIVSTIDLAANAEVLAERVDLNDRDMADAVVFSPLGDYIFVATQGTNTVEVFDAYNNRLMTGITNVGRAPQGLALSADGSRLYVQNFLSRNVTVYDVSGIVSSTSNTFRQLATVATITLETLPPQVLQGKQVFYNADDRRMNRDGYISCASCHLDGDSDGRVWDFTDRGEGLRNTAALQGRGGLLHGNVHWTANFDELQDFEHDIRGSFGGLGFLSDSAFTSGNRNTPLGGAKAGISADLDALAAYVSSLTSVGRSPFRDAGGGLSADGQAGKLIFNQLQCYSCHAGAEFTDSRSGLSHNVGTLKASSGKASGQTLTGLDTPSLKGVWQTAPYLHDGSAATLLDVLTSANPANQHGNLSALSSQQRSQLIAYLQQIDDIEQASAPSQLVVGALSGREQVPPVTTTARGQARVVLGPDGVTALVSLRLSGLSSAQTSARLHGPAAAGASGPALWTLPNGAFSNHSISLTAQQAQQLKDGLLYITVQTSTFPNGEIRAQLRDASILPPVVPTERNLAQGRPATASSAEGTNPVASGNDGDPATRWSANSGGAGQWWQVDLGAAYSLTGSEVMWEFAGRQYRYRVEASSNGTTWSTVADK
ncbi:MAG TPA: CHRD domain-containing protein, partial [Roseiflexaceae bacterium]|nr:CHRD domain-containing protein [Roseiflexaceae bacterium]